MRLRVDGRNVLRMAGARSALSLLVAQLKSLIVLLLVVAMILAASFGQWLEAVAVLSVLIVNTAIGFLTELKATRSMEALRRLGVADALVLRGGQKHVVPASELVSGDVVLLTAGDVVTADLRLLHGSRVQADESLLTGESMPVAKSAGPVPHDAIVAERPPMLFKGTSLTRGSAAAVVVDTGMRTQLGRISELVAEAGDETTPLERRLQRLGRALVWVTLALAAVVVGSGLATGMSPFLVVQTAIALAVGAIPEGLPVIATIALARGMRRMYMQNVLVNRLSAVETLGSATVICTDKTGTLTHNRLTVAQVHVADEPTGPVRGRALEIAARCTDDASSLGENGQPTGDPLEVALLSAAAEAGIHRHALENADPKVLELAFCPESKRMATVHASGLVCVKGAPEVIVTCCTRELTQSGPVALTADAVRRWRDANATMSHKGLRVLAVAEGVSVDPESFDYEDLVLIALVGFHDPARDDVAPAIDACKAAGVRVVMVTGDQAPTALYIARAVGIAAGQVLARVSPEQKLDLVRGLQTDGEIVAMTGDGVNDAPALRQADIGIAMGKRGTDVARDASEMVLLEDRFSAIVSAIQQGRTIFDNIRAFVAYLLSCNLAEILVITVATLGRAPLPLLPLQILYLNLLTDVFPALALGVSEGDEPVMHRPPRPPKERIVPRRLWVLIAVDGVLLTAGVMVAFFVALRSDPDVAVTISFLTLAFAQLWHVFAMRGPGTHPLRNGVTRNPWVWSALVLCAALLLAAVYVGPLAAVLKLSPPSAPQWGLILVASLTTALAVQALRLALDWVRSQAGLQQRARPSGVAVDGVEDQR